MEEGIICPHCDCLHDEWWEYINFEEDDQEFEMICENCSEKFKVDVVVKRTFHTYKCF